MKKRSIRMITMLMCVILMGQSVHLDAYAHSVKGTGAPYYTDVEVNGENADGQEQAEIVSLESDNGIITVTADVKYGQTEARKMLGMLNDFRHEEGVWAWNADNVTKTYYTNLDSVAYDYKLEEIAMQRAVEIAFDYNHVRPDGSSFDSLYVGYTGRGEGIAAGQTSIEEAFEAWREEYEDYDGQCHRRIMLERSIRGIGVGHVIYNGVHYWAVEFGKPLSGYAETAPCDSNALVDVDIKSSSINRASVTPEKSIYDIKDEDGIFLPNLKVKLNLSTVAPHAMYNNVPIVVDALWTVENEAIAQIRGNKVYGLRKGTTYLVTEILGQCIRVQLNVEKEELPYTTTDSVLGKTYDELVNSLKSSAFANYKNTLIKNESYIIPGIEQTNIMNIKGCGTMVAQGVCIAGDYLLISAYDKCDAVKEKSSYKHSPKCNSVLYVMDAKTGNYITTVAIDSTCHVGALAYNPDEGVIYIADTDEYVVWKLPYQQIDEKAKSGVDASFVELAYGYIDTGNNTPSFLTYYQKRLYVGRHETKKETLSRIAVYKPDGTLLKDTLSIPMKSQGVSFIDWTDGNTYMLLSVSLGRRYKAELVVKSTERGEDGSLQIKEDMKTLIYPNMSEDIEIHGDRLYSCYESAANFYRLGLDKKGVKSINVVDRIMVNSIGKTLNVSGVEESALRQSANSVNMTGNPGESIASGTCGENLQYVLYGDGSLNVTGSGDMADYSQTAAPWTDYKDSITRLTVGANVDSIGAGAFADCTNLKTVILSKFSSPDAIFVIGERAFAGCNSLEKVSLANKEYSIAPNAFPTDGKNYVIESDAQSVITYCMNNALICHTHTYEMKETIEPDCGNGGYDLYACDCGSEEVRNPVSMNGEHTYELVLDTEPTCAEQGINGYQCTVCGAYYETYEEGPEHTWVKGDSQTSQEDGCVYINYTCSVCGEAKTEKVECEHKEGNVLYTGGGEKTPTCTQSGIGHTECVNCKMTIRKNVTVSALGHKWNNGVVTKKPTAVKNGEKTYTCTRCKTTKKEVVAALGAPKKGRIAKSKTSIYEVTKSDLKNGTATYVGPISKNAAIVLIPDTVTIDGVVFKITAISKNAFKNDKIIKTVYIGNNVKTIGDKAFYKCTALTSVTIPNRVTTIGKYAFYKCKKLSTVILGKRVSTIGSKAFYGCSKLQTLNIKSSKLKTSKIGSSAFSKTPKKMSVIAPKKKLKAYKTMLRKKGVNKKAKFVKG